MSIFPPFGRFLPVPSAGRQILLTGTFLLLVAGLSIGMLSTFVFQHYVKEQLSSRLNGIMINRNDTFESIIEDTIDKAVLVNSSGGILRNLAVLHTEPGNFDSLLKLQSDAESLVQHGYQSVRFYTADDHVLLTEGATTHAATQTINLIASIPTQLIWKSGFILRTREKLYDSSRQHIGTIELERALPNLTRIYLKKRPIGTTYDSFTCGRADDGLVACFPALLTQKLIQLPALDKRNKLPIDFALESETGIRSAIDYRGQRVIAAYGPVGTFGLATVAKVDEADLNVPAKDLIENVLFAVVGLILISTVLLNARIRPLVNRLTDAEHEAKAATLMAIEREVKIQAVIEHANDGIVTMGSDGIIRSINRAGANLFGHTAEALIGQHYTVLLPTRHRYTSCFTFEQYKLLGSDAPEKRRIHLMTGLHASGAELYFELGANQITSHGEDLFIGIIHDVTESRRMQQALQDSEQRLRTITDNLPVLIAYVNSDKQYVFANITYEKWFSRPRAEIIGKPVELLFSPAAYQTIAPYIEQALSGETVRYEARSLEVGAPAYGEITYLPDLAANGTVQGYYVLGIDTSAQKLAEAALEKERELLTTVLETIDVGVVACDADGTLNLFNRATKDFHGLPQQDLTPEEWSSYYSLYRADGITPMTMNEIPLFKALRGEPVDHQEMAIRSSAGLGFNEWMQHIKLCVSRRSVADETKTEDLLL